MYGGDSGQRVSWADIFLLFLLLSFLIYISNQNRLVGEQVFNEYILGGCHDSYKTI